MTIYFVSTDGNDTNTGNIQSPFASIQHAADLATAGDTIYVRGGTYKIQNEIQLTHSGSEGKPITVAAYNGEHPVIDASAMTSTDWDTGWIIRMHDVSWNHIVGLEIKNGVNGGVCVDGNSSNNIIEQIDSHHNGRLSEYWGNGFDLDDTASNNLFLNNNSHDNRDIEGNDADGFVIDGGSGNVFRGNRAYHNADDGFDAFNNSFDKGDAGQSVVLDGNWSFENGYDAQGNALGDGNGFKLGGQRAGLGNTSGGHILTNNVSWGNRDDGFDSNAATNGLTLSNNTAYNNGSLNYRFSQTGANTLHNNISLGSHGVATSSTTDASFNSWTLPIAVTLADFLSVDDAAARGARLTDGSLPVSDFLHLAANSDLIDAGKSLGFAFTGSAPDLGAFETGTSSGAASGSDASPGSPGSDPVAGSGTAAGATGDSGTTASGDAAGASGGTGSAAGASGGTEVVASAPGSTSGGSSHGQRHHTISGHRFARSLALADSARFLPTKAKDDTGNRHAPTGRHAQASWYEPVAGLGLGHKSFAADLVDVRRLGKGHNEHALNPRSGALADADGTKNGAGFVNQDHRQLPHQSQWLKGDS